MIQDILIVDDETEICLLLAKQLKKMEYRVDTAKNLSMAREMLHTGNYQKVFLDINLPDGNGFTLIPDILVANPSTSIVIMSAYDEHVEKELSQKLGAAHFLSKPFGKKDILLTLETNEENSNYE